MIDKQSPRGSKNKSVVLVALVGAASLGLLAAFAPTVMSGPGGWEFLPAVMLQDTIFYGAVGFFVGGAMAGGIAFVSMDH